MHMKSMQYVLLTFCERKHQSASKASEWLINIYYLFVGDMLSKLLVLFVAFSTVDTASAALIVKEQISLNVSLDSSVSSTRPILKQTRSHGCASDWYGSPEPSALTGPGCGSGHNGERHLISGQDPVFKTRSSNSKNFNCRRLSNTICS